MRPPRWRCRSARARAAADAFAAAVAAAAAGVQKPACPACRGSGHCPARRSAACGAQCPHVRAAGCDVGSASCRRRFRPRRRSGEGTRGHGGAAASAHGRCSSGGAGGDEAQRCCWRVRAVQHACILLVASRVVSCFCRSGSDGSPPEIHTGRHIGLR
eukprot:214647-Chlamydomonas_euryale.AAC.1